MRPLRHEERVACSASIIHQDVNAPHLLEGRLDQFVRLIKIAHVSLDDNRLAALRLDGGHDLLRLLGAGPMVDDHSGPLGRQPLRDSSPNTPRCTCDNGHFAFESHVSCPFTSTPAKSSSTVTTAELSNSPRPAAIIAVYSSRTAAVTGIETFSARPASMTMFRSLYCI